MALSPAVYLDKDGTLVQNVSYNVEPSRMRLAAGVASLKSLKDAGFSLVVVSNQSGVSRGLFTEDELVTACTFLRDMLRLHGVELDGIYYCPHHPAGTTSPYATRCNCRKPMPGLLLRAAEDLDLEPSASWMVGDILDDIEAGNRAGCRTALIDNGNETQWLGGPFRAPDVVAADLPEAVRLILESRRRPAGEVA